MEIALFIKELREQGIAIKLVKDQLEVSLLNDHIESDTLKLLKQRKAEIIEYLSFSVSIKEKVQEIPQIKKALSYAVSNAQLRIWIESQSTDASIAYNMPFEMMLEGEYDLTIFKKAIHYVVGRHEILRTIFKLDDNQELKQYILPLTEINPHIVSKDYRKTDIALKKVDDYIKKDSSTHFDLGKGPLFRMAMFQYENNKYIFYCNVHHIICDAWSVPILKREIAISHQAFRENKTPSLPTLRIQYKDYAAWYLQQLNSVKLNKQKKYWKGLYRDGIPVLELPLKQGRPSIKTYNGGTLKTYFSDDSAKLLRSYARRNNGSLFMVMLGTLHVMLSKYTGNGDIVIGSPFAAREHLDLQNQIGFYTNTLAIRNTLESEDSFDYFFSKVKHQVLEAYVNQQYPFEELVKELNIDKDPSRNPIFDVMLVVLPQDQKQGANTTEDFDHQTITKKANTTSKFDLLFYVQEIENNHLSLRVEYNRDLFETTFIEQFIRHYKSMVDSLLTQPQKLVRDISYLNEGEGIIESAVRMENYSKKVVIELFEDQVSKTPHATAIQYEDITLTYQQLNAYANQLAFCLRKKYQVTTQTNLGVILGRSHWNIIAMLGVMKSGGCYVPIDNEYQLSRKKYIFDDAEISTVISVTGLVEDDIQNKANVVYLDKFTFSDWDKYNLPIVNKLDHTSFIIYTSGSTGNPKGVIQTHRMLSNLIQWNIYDSGIENGLKHLQYNSFSFDVSLQDCWFVLSSGGKLLIVPELIKIDFEALSNFILTNDIEVLSLPFAAVKGLFDFCEELEINDHHIKHIISSGEQLMVNGSLEKFLQANPSVKLHNHYGPSETHVITSYIMSGEEGGILSHAPIGKPVTNTSIYLLDKNLQPVPKKVIGEIFVAGEHLAKGYLKMPELTEERFVSNLIQENCRLYKTGDLAYEDYSGNLIYKGRKDSQIKIRGYRVELGEIESVLLAQEGITNAAVVIRGEEDTTIIAYLVIKRNSTLNKNLLRQRLGEKLPKYMLPTYYVELESIPLTSNGKVNKKLLPKATEKELVNTTYIVPETQIEKKLEVMWRKLLGIGHIGIFDNFFELGGHSLQLTRMLYEINKAFDVKLQIKNLFAAQNIYDLARVIEDEIILKKGIKTNQEGQIENEQNSETWEI